MTVSATIVNTGSHANDLLIVEDAHGLVQNLCRGESLTINSVGNGDVHAFSTRAYLGNTAEYLGAPRVSVLEPEPEGGPVLLGDRFPITAGNEIGVVLKEIAARVVHSAGQPMGVGDHEVREADGAAGPIVAEHILDEHGNPAGGHIVGIGYAINFQQGPLGRGDERQEPNGAFVEDVLRAIIMRMEFYQSSKFACGENASAIEALNEALGHMIARTANREERGVEGTHEV